MFFRVFSAILSAFLCVSAQLTFVTPPSITDDGGTWTIAFSLSDSTDVEVSIVNLKDSTIVRHLAAGVLGSNPPAPLQANSLSQTLAWDGKDDLGIQVVDTDSLSVRVRAGMAVDFDRFVGGNPYAFRDENSGYWSFNGMAQGDSGMVYVSGTVNPHGASAIRAFDGAGNYLRTIYPFRGDFQATQVSGFGVNNWLNGQYAPKFSSFLANPSLPMTTTLLSIGQPGKVAVGGGKGLTIQTFNSNGTIDPASVQVSLVTSPALPNHYYVFGPMYLNKSHNPDFCYLSGYHGAAEINSGCGLVRAADTGFWRDGGVFKINMNTGAATRFISIDSIPDSGAARLSTIGGDWYTAAMGVTADAQGNVFVCDRFHGRIGIYDSNGVYLKCLPDVPNPDQVRLDPVTGCIFVIQRSGWHYGGEPLILKKYSGWGVSDSLVYSIVLWNNLDEWKSNFFATRSNEGKTVLWFGNAEKGVRIYQDEGDTVVLIRDFYATKVNNLGFDRIAVDRRTETVFINSGSSDVYKVTDWTSPAQVRCSTSTGQKLYAGDLCVSFDGQLYTRGGNGFSGPAERWTIEARHAPIPFSVTGTNSMTMTQSYADAYGPYIIYGRMGIGYGDKGLAVSPIDKHVAVMQMHDFCDYWVDTIAAEGSTDTIHKPGRMPRSLIHAATGGLGGLKYDLKGALYVGASIITDGHRVKAGFETDYTYTRGGGGSIIRYSAGDTGTITQAGNLAGNSSYVYKSNNGPLSGFGGCMCRNTRFDIDPYGRLFVPSGLTQSIAVVDNNDNPILEFGRYGNWDETGNGTDVPMACPLAVGATENYIYINDLVNTRLVRVQMTYDLDNMPGFFTLGSGKKAETVAAVSLSSLPNPFNPESRVVFSLPNGADVKLAVYDLSGRMVKTLANGAFKAGTHHAAWNGTDNRGAKVSAGMYVYRLVAGNKVLIKRTILAK